MSNKNKTVFQKLEIAVEQRLKRMQEIVSYDGWKKISRRYSRNRHRQQTDIEIKLYEKFKAIVHEKELKQAEKDKEIKRKIQENIPLSDGDTLNVCKFEIEDVNKLGVHYDILFIASKKGVGKTWSIKQLMKDSETKNASIIYFRQTKIAVETNIPDELNGDDTWPFFVEGKSPSRLYSKNVVNEHNEPKERGYCFYLSGSSSVFGQTYPNVDKIIFDEVMAHKDNDITPKDMKEWTKVLGSIIRDKRGVKVYLFGNLLELEDSKVEQPFLTEYGLDWTDNLKIQTHRTPEGTEFTLLYINTRELYHGMERQGIIGLSMNDAYLAQLYSNSIAPESPNVLVPDTYFNMEVVHDILFWGSDEKKERYAIEFRKCKHEVITGVEYFLMPIPKEFYACRITKFIPEVHCINTFSTSFALKGSFDFVKLISEKTEAFMLLGIRSLIMAGKMWYGDTHTYLNIEHIINTRLSKIPEIKYI